MSEPATRTLTWAQGGAGRAVTLLVDNQILAWHEEDRRLATVAHLSDLTSSVVAQDLGDGGSLYVRHERGAAEMAVEWPREDQDEYGREMTATLYVSSGPGWAAEALADSVLGQAKLLQAHDVDLRPGLHECRDRMTQLLHLSSNSGCAGWRHTRLHIYRGRRS